MEIYLGSYDGSVTVLLATPTQIHQISHLQLSSVKYNLRLELYQNCVFHW